MLSDRLREADLIKRKEKVKKTTTILKTMKT